MCNDSSISCSLEREQWQDGTLTLFQLSSSGSSLDVSFTVSVRADLSFTVSFYGTFVDLQRCALLADLPYCITNSNMHTT